MDKKNNKGFTLIEILAAVTILAIISTVVVVSVVRYINKSRNSVYETMEKSICDAASNYVINENLETEVTEAGDEGITYEGKKLMADKYLEDLTDPRNKKKNCKASVNIKVLNSDDSEMGISEYAYNVKLKCSGYSSTVDFTQGCAVKNRTVENTPDDTDDDPISPDTPDPSNPDNTKKLLYNVVADETKGLDASVNFRIVPTSTNSGVYTRVGTETGQYPVHYYRGIIDNNNVLFAGFCWKMVRTTDTGGVKLIYNGVPGENNSCNNTDENSQIGVTAFFSGYNSSPVDNNYMYGTRPEHFWLWYSSEFIINIKHIFSDSNYYYSDSIKYSDGKYSLINASQKIWADNYSDLVGYYTCGNYSKTCTTLYYIIGGSKERSDVLILSDGADLLTSTITLGEGVMDNGNGTYTLTAPITVKKKDWYTDYSNYKNYYICRDLMSTTCENKNLVHLVTPNLLFYDHTFNFIYGNDVTWDGTKYTLVDTFVSTLFSLDKAKLAPRYHYTCFNTSGECNSVSYISDFRSESYLKITDGKNIETVKEEMFSNVNSSKIKKTIDDWYKANMISYTEKLEDTIWCSDRTATSGPLQGNNSDGIFSTYYGAATRIFAGTPSIVCPNAERDGFTVSPFSGGNGKLIYPVALLTADEVMLAGEIPNNRNSNYYLYTKQFVWLLSPYNTESPFSTYYFTGVNSGCGFGVRPAVSLAYGARAISGTGTADNPYIVE